MTPLVRHTGLPDLAAYTLVVLLMLVLSAATLVIFVPLLVDGIASLTEALPTTLARVGAQLEHYAWGRDLLTQLGDVDWGNLTAGTLSRLAGFFSTAFGALSAFVLVTITGLYLAADPAAYRDGTIALLPPRARARAAAILEAQRHAIEWWLIGRFASMAVVGLLTWLALLALGVPLAATLALLAGLLSFIPNIGPILSAIPAVLIGAAVAPTTGLYVVLLYIAVQVVETYLITPLIQRRTINLPPATVLIMQIAFTALYGFLGLLLATPLTVLLMVFIKTIYMEEILGERTTLP